MFENLRQNADIKIAISDLLSKAFPAISDPRSELDGYGRRRYELLIRGVERDGWVAFSPTVRQAIAHWSKCVARATEMLEVSRRKTYILDGSRLECAKEDVEQAQLILRTFTRIQLQDEEFELLMDTEGLDGCKKTFRDHLMVWE